ncbi:MAG: Hsp20/alpha crystallin family protein [Clostridiaceae bacterium]|jgi:HSP20 family protein|nr:Hsp20/alpha crystallin family protein [Oscillospiraceae bacterium]NLO63355.1 Hsp20/alpha crystallin family protein [Clostridiaceae bacterium]
MAGLVPFNRKNTNALSTGFDDFQNMLDDFFSDGWPIRRSLAADTFKVDVEDRGNEYAVEAEMPGVDKRDVTIRMDDKRLTIAVKKSNEVEEKKKNYIHKERRYCSMSRSIYLTDASAEGIKAKLNDGVLHVTVPKKEAETSGQSIEIE